MKSKINDNKKSTNRGIILELIFDICASEAALCHDYETLMLYELDLKEKEEVDIEQFVETSIDDEALKVSFKELMEERGIETNFNIDKKWVEKKLKKRSIKTDNGFDIKGNLVDFEDPMKYSVRQNEDGTVDIVIKNVSFFEEK